MHDMRSIYTSVIQKHGDPLEVFEKLRNHDGQQHSVLSFSRSVRVNG